LKDDETFRVRFILLEPENRRVLVSTLETKNEDSKEHWVDFKMWDYAMMLMLKEKATAYSPQARSFMLDSDKLDNLKIKYLMKEWSFSEIDPAMKLQHVNGILTDESITMFSNLYPVIAVNIIREMNKVLEGYA